MALILTCWMRGHVYVSINKVNLSFTTTLLHKSSTCTVQHAASEQQRKQRRRRNRRGYGRPRRAAEKVGVALAVCGGARRG